MGGDPDRRGGGGRPAAVLQAVHQVGYGRIVVLFVKIVYANRTALLLLPIAFILNWQINANLQI